MFDSSDYTGDVNKYDTSRQRMSVGNNANVFISPGSHNANR